MSGWGCVLIKFHLQNLEAYGVDLQAIVCQLPLEIFSDTWGEKKRWKEKRAKAKGKPGHSLASPGATASEPGALEPVHHKRSPCNEKPAHHS